MSLLDQVIRALGWTLIHSLWLGTLAGALYALAAGLWRSRHPQGLESTPDWPCWDCWRWPSRLSSCAASRRRPSRPPRSPRRWRNSRSPA